MSVMVSILLCMLFFFKQKTAYEMRISDWSSDVCSTDLDDILLLLGLVDLRDHGIEGIGEVRRRSGRRHAGRCRRLRLAQGAASRDHFGPNGHHIRDRR